MQSSRDDDSDWPYARARLWAGIVSIGFNLALVWGLWLWARSQPFASIIPPPLHAALGMVILFTAIALANLPLDLATGFFLEKAYRRGITKLTAWWANWFSGIVALLPIQVLGGTLFAAWLFNYPLAGAVLVLLPGIYVGLRIWQFHLIPSRLKKPGQWKPGYEEQLRTELKRLGGAWPEDLYLYRAEDLTLVNGGRIGLGDHTRLMVSDACQEHLTPRELALLLHREDGLARANSPQRNLDLSIFWALTGILLLIGLVGTQEMVGWRAFFFAVAWMTTWHWLGLFCLPWLARREVLFGDRWLARNGSSKEEVRALITKLQKLNGTDEELPLLTEAVFHPIPSLHTRLKNLA
ncbi:MAG: hypothetical protein OHK005_04090 [Candidatus Methylacidiphilales bacterium]